MTATKTVVAQYITTSFGFPNVQNVTFYEGQNVGTVTNPSRFGNDGITYVDFRANDGRVLTIKKDSLVSSVSLGVKTDYSTLGTQAATTAKTGVIDKIGSILGSIGSILTTVKGKSTPPVSADNGTQIDLNPDGSNGNSPDQPNNTLWYVIGGLVLLVGGIIGFIAYQKAKRKAKTNA